MDTSRAAIGYVVKNGTRYVLAWRNAGERDYSVESNEDLEALLSYAEAELHLYQGRSADWDLQMERVWVSDRLGSYVLLWKTPRHEMLHQLTFNSQKDAQHFYRAFQQGAYTPSPYGHSLLLLPKK